LSSNGGIEMQKTIYVKSNNLWNRVVKLAEKKNQSVSNVIEEALLDWLRNNTIQTKKGKELSLAVDRVIADWLQNNYQQ
jgi:hypothetical protein